LYPRRTYQYVSVYPAEVSTYAAAPLGVERAYAAPKPALAMTEAFAALAEGRTAAARAAFSAHAIAAPLDSLPKVGYALSSALESDDRSAIWAMRRAIGAGAEALRSFTADQGLRPRIEDLIERYTFQAAAEPALAADAWFMTAALHFLLHDEADARAALDKAIQAGDREPSTHALETVLETPGSERPTEPLQPAGVEAEAEDPTSPEITRASGTDLR
jgi:hypothetical protein